MDRQIRLCIVSPLFHPNIGGPGRQAYTMASELNKKGITLMVITRKLDIEIPDLDVKSHRVRTPMPQRYTLSEFTFLNFLISAFFSLGMMVRLFQWRKRFDIVQFYGASLPLLISLPLLKILKKKIVAKLSGAKPGMEAGSFEGFILKPFLSRVFSLVDNFIVMSDELKHRLLVENYPETKVVKIPNGIDIKLFFPFDTEESLCVCRATGRW
jgi:glycosyltransferase involved in cell wall biosynthesis